MKFIHPHDWAGRFFDLFTDPKNCDTMMVRHGFEHIIRINSPLRYDHFRALVDPHMGAKWTFYTARLIVDADRQQVKEYVHVVGATSLADAIMAKLAGG